MSSRVVTLTFVICFVHTCVGKFAVPSASFEVISPKGFRVSIPDIEGITLFGFHGSPFPMRSPRVGLWPRDVTKPTNGRWTYTNRDAELNLGDKIYFWTYVVYDGVGYREEDGEWTVRAQGDEIVEKVNQNAIHTSKPTTSDSIDNDVNMKQENQNMKEALESSTSSSTTDSQSQPSVSLRMPECKTVSEVRNLRNICSGDLLFESNFNTQRTLDEQWTPEVVFPEAPDYPFVVYMNGDHISLNNGHLSIKPIFLEEKFGEGFTRKTLALEGCTGEIGTQQCKKTAAGSQILPPIVSGKLTTKDTFNFKYGRVEIQAKMPKGNWILPEMLLEPRDKKYGSLNYASGLMKVASIKGNDDYAGQLVGGVIMNDQLPFRNFGLRVQKGEDSWSNDYHNYTLVWRPDGISLYVDGENYGNIEESESFSEIGKTKNIEAATEWARGSKIAPFDEMFYISLGIRAGGVNDFWDETAKPWKNRSRKAIVNFWKSKDSWAPTWSEAELQVESVRVYAL